MSLSILLAACATVLFSVSIPLLFHFAEIEKRHRALWTLWFSLLPIYALSFAWLSDIHLTPFLNGIFLYFVAAYFLIQLYYQVERGVSMRILVAIENSPERRLDPDTLKQIYTYDFILTRRLDLACKLNLLDSDGKRYWLTPKGRFSNFLFQSAKRFYQLDPFS